MGINLFALPVVFFTLRLTELLTIPPPLPHPFSKLQLKFVLSCTFMMVVGFKNGNRFCLIVNIPTNSSQPINQKHYQEG